MKIKYPILLLIGLMFTSKLYSQESELSAPILLAPQVNDTLTMADTAFVWQKVPGAESYRVLAALDSATFTIILWDSTVIRDTSLSLKNLIGTKLRIGWKYYWRVKAQNENGTSPYSDTRSFIALQVNKYLPAKPWYDVNNQLINAHGGGFLYDEPTATYYWYGEARPESGWCAFGVSCYSSKNLMNWKFEGIVLSDSVTNSTGTTPVLERPKVIYNEKTNKYVMWMHIDYSNYGLANAGVAVSDSPTGPFEYLGSESPNNAMSRDMTLFKDDDGKAYLFSSSEDNKTMYVSLLSDDYLSQSGTFRRNLIGLWREAPAVYKYKNKYYMISSGCTGWDPNEALYAVASTPLGYWTLLDNPCLGEDASITFGGQSTYVLPIDAEAGKFIFMADKWNSKNLITSTYIWLPLIMEDNNPVIKWYPNWDISIFDEITDLDDYPETEKVSLDYQLKQNYPNPFNPITTINYIIPHGNRKTLIGNENTQYVEIKVYNLLGERVALLVNENKSSGSYSVKFDASFLPTGIYFYTLTAGSFSITKKMLYLK